MGADRNPMRILHLHAGNLYGGVETLLVTLARLRDLCPGMEPHFALCYEGRLSRELKATGVPVYILGAARIRNPWTAWRANRRLRELLRRESFHVVCHMPWPLVVFGRTARAGAQKLILWAHSAHSGESRLERMAMRTTPDLMISNSHYVTASLSNLFPAAPTRLLYYPLELKAAPEAAQWRTAVRREQAVGDETTVIIQVSRFEDWKGHLLHLNSLAKLKTTKDWVCWMVGGPQNPMEERHYRRVRETAEQLGLTGRVRFLGQRSDVVKLLAGADIFCQPNEGPEPFGIVFVEALWAQRPIVTTAMGGALEILTESCGILVEPANPDALAAALQLLIESPDLRSRLGAAGPARARQLCDPAVQIAMLHDILEKAGAGPE
jgi:glycosyltransferase involved in cell wall biosynthesis